MIIDLSGKKTLITGGTRGIGASCVELFAQAGSDIAFVYKSSKELAGELERKFSSKINIKGFYADFDKTDELESAAEEIVHYFNGIDILVNNAGIWEYGPADKMTVDDWEKTVRVNLTSSFIFIKAVLPGMKEKRFGKIINISSTAGQRGEAFHSHYAASKGGMISLTKSLAAEVGNYNINVNSVAPGWVLTDMCNDVFSDEEYKEKVRTEIPIGRIAAAEDIAGPVLFLASEMARHINGEILNVNGGSVLCG